MSPTPIAQLAREFAVCVCLSFVTVLGVIHGILHLLHASIASGLAHHLPHMNLVAPPEVQLTHIAHIHAYLLVVFKITIACTVLVLALREIVYGVGSWTGWWDMADREGDLEEAEDYKTEVRESSPWADEKKCSRGLPYPNSTVIF
ncbi:hypothetical protein C8R45DRAFT_1102192 [Mycena sanguinolenta]|nr:hypothetical protein C8R45DRAFT_1102192 [Mycena sanguinolenta]